MNIKPYITDEDKMGIIGNLTVRMKTIIRRDFLVANFKGAYGNNTVATLLLDFARRHMPEELANIEREQGIATSILSDIMKKC